MRRRLFWKLLAAAWITLAAVAIGNALLFHSVASAVRPLGEAVAAHYDELELAAAAEILQAQGLPALQAFLARLPEGDHTEIAPGDDPSLQQPLKEVTRWRVVHSPSGDFTLRISGSPAFPQTPPVLLQAPAGLLVLDFLALTLFSVVIAQYLARPIRRLSTAMARVAEGDLGVRVADKLDGRRDELADLAHAFDHMADRLQQLLQAREQLLHDVSHEFRSPLTRIRLACELALKDPKHRADSLERIVHDAERLSLMVDELLTMSRVQFAASKSETYFDLVELLREVVADVRFEAEAAHVTLDFVVGEQTHDRGELLVNGNPDLLRKAVENVLRNAVKFSKPSQTVTLYLSSPASAPDVVQIEVSDRGPGVPEQALERIFEPFERLEQSSGNSGFGLGLTIARSAVTAHRGTIRAANRPGGGLVVTLRLPLARGALPAPSSALSSASASG